MKKVLITGGGGQLGRALNALFAGTDTTVVNTNSATLDICDLPAVLALTKKEKPDTIINCAAFTAVDACEVEKKKAEAVNAIGPKNLSVAAQEVGAQIVQVSTDYVFDGKTGKPYTEADAPHPQSVYGVTKLAGERAVADTCLRHYIVRTAWLYGEGKNFVRTMLNLAQNQRQISVVDDQFGSPTSAAALARAILFIADTGSYGVYHATCEGVTSWYAFARAIFSLAKIPVTVTPVSTEEYVAAAAKRGGTTAPRPPFSVLNNTRLEAAGYRMKGWEEALEEYMENPSLPLQRGI